MNQHPGRVLFLLVSALILSVAAYGEPGTRIVSIRLAAPECSGAPNEISVVLNGRDGEDVFPAYREIGTDRWTGRSDEDFNPGTSYASLRLGVARTDCVSTVAGDDYARLTFVCSRRPARSVTVIPDPKTFLVRYVREVPRNPENRRSIPCTEHGLLRPSVQGTVKLVQFPSERLRLQLAWKEPDPKRPDTEPPGLLVDHPAVIRQAEKGGTKTLEPEKVLNAYRVQRAEGLMGQAPSLSPNAYENDRIRLRAAGLKSLALTVK
jgi:hypothetical protein